jgi:hypothetical protein
MSNQLNKSTNNPEFPSDFDPLFYRDTYADLAFLDDSQISDHFEKHGKFEGRMASFPAARENFLGLIRTQKSILEIGPFCSPVVTGSNVRYFDVLDTECLIRRAKEIGYSSSRAPTISYVSATGDLSVVTDQFPCAISAHCIEHQPDLVHHLQQVSNLLDHEGYYFLIVPNKLYCFDHYIPESTLDNIVDAHLNRHQLHKLESVIEHRAFTTHNDARRHWRSDHADAGYQEGIPRRVERALAEFNAAPNKYIDVHAWQFTPSSFRCVVQGLYDSGYSPFEPTRVYNTPKDRNEFCAILQKRDII